MSHPLLDLFFSAYEAESTRTLSILRSLPEAKYDFRPDAGGRSLGELGWHLAEIELYIGVGIEERGMNFARKIPGGERPRTVGELAPGYERIHRETAARLSRLTLEDLSRVIPFVPGRDLAIQSILWDGFLLHAIHHRGQLSYMVRLAEGVAPGIYGPNREESKAMREKG